MEQKLSQLQAFKVMQCFLEKYFERTSSEDIGSLLGDIQLLQNNTTMDPAAWSDWLECIDKSMPEN
jgi:hypothetical protein